MFKKIDETKVLQLLSKIASKQNDTSQSKVLIRCFLRAFFHSLAKRLKNKVKRQAINQPSHISIVFERNKIPHSIIQNNAFIFE